MTIHYVKPVLNGHMRSLCYKPYPGHPKGCPNFGKRDICPPKAPLFELQYDMNKRFLAIVIHFDLGQHMQRMKEKHPRWSDRQCACCLYWQGTVRKQLREEIAYNINRRAIFDGYPMTATDCPEAMGVDVTATMKQAGIILEWPPKKIVRKIAFLGVLNGAKPLPRDRDKEVRESMGLFS